MLLIEFRLFILLNMYKKILSCKFFDRTFSPAEPSAPLNRQTPELNLMLVKKQAGFPSPADVQAVMPIEEFHVVACRRTCSTWLSVMPMESYVYRMTCTLVDTLSVSGLSSNWSTYQRIH